MTTAPVRPTLRPRTAPLGPYLRGPRLAWAALFANVMAFQHLAMVVPIPGPVGQLLAQGMLPLAVVLALMANPNVLVRPNAFVAVLTAMAVLALMVSIHNEFVIGSSYRAVRLILFVVVLWLLTPWWGASDLALVGSHLTCLRWATGVVLLGAVLAPGKAFSFQGRLSGVLWPVPPTQVAHYAAVLAGITAILWFCGLASGRATAVTLVASAAVLIGSHTRTALLAMVIGLGVAGASLFLGHLRVRRTAAVVTVVVAASAFLFASQIIAWAGRGQTAQEASQLTGRTKVWNAILGLHRAWPQEWFGAGLSNKSFQGLPIDSTWIATYYDQGWVGVGLVIVFLVALTVLALTWSRGPRRALALFLVTYCLVASFTETGLGDASPYLLDLAVAASLVARPMTKRRS